MLSRTIFLLSLFLCNISFAGNWGHRAGGDLFKDLPENSLESLSKLCEQKYQNNKKLIYLEFDVWEIADGSLVVFHDKFIKKKLPYKWQKPEVLQNILDRLEQVKGKKMKYRDVKITDLYLDEVKSLIYSKSTQSHPASLDEFVNTIETCEFTKPVVVEIKGLFTEYARENLIQNLIKLQRWQKNKRIGYEKKYDFIDASGELLPSAVFGFRSSIEKSFGDLEGQEFLYWCHKYRELGFGGIYQTYTHENLCK